MVRSVIDDRMRSPCRRPPFRLWQDAITAMVITVV
jgi:hypothetical protein